MSSSSPSDKKKDVRKTCQNNEMSRLWVKRRPRSHDFANSMSMRRFPFDLYRDHTKQEDLNGGATCIPEGTTDSIFPGNVGALQDRSSPSPLRKSYV